MFNWLHPGFILIITGLLMIVLPERIRRIAMIAAPALAAAAVVLLKEGSWLDYEFIPGLTLKLLEVDRLSMMFGVIFAAGALIAAIYLINIIIIQAYLFCNVKLNSLFVFYNRIYTFSHF